MAFIWVITILQLRMYNRSGTGGRCACTHQVAALFYTKWRYGHHLEIM